MPDHSFAKLSDLVNTTILDSTIIDHNCMILSFSIAPKHSIQEKGFFQKYTILRMNGR